jgi:hypothetical protein
MAWPWRKTYGKRVGMVPEPPNNGGYLIAAYIVAAVILLGYWLRLLRLVRKAQLGNRRAPSA